MELLNLRENKQKQQKTIETTYRLIYQNSVASAGYRNIIQIASARQVAAFSEALCIFQLLYSAHEYTALLWNTGTISYLNNPLDLEQQ